MLDLKKSKNNNRPIKDAVSVVIKNNEGKVLFALRSKYIDSDPSTWSLPSYFVKEGETFEETVVRIGRDKLGVELKPGKMLIEGKKDRGDFILFMHDFETEIISGIPSCVWKHYTQLKWEDPVIQLKNMTKMGECCRLYKEFLNI